MLRRSISILVILALLAFVAAASAGVAHAQTTEGPTPSLQAADGENQGEVELTWGPVEGEEAASWRVGWLAVVDYQEHQANGEFWQYFAYSDVTTHSSWTVRRLTPGVEYYFVVGQENAEGSLEWLPAATFQLALKRRRPARPIHLPLARRGRRRWTTTWSGRSANRSGRQMRLKSARR